MRFIPTNIAGLTLIQKKHDDETVQVTTSQCHTTHSDGTQWLPVPTMTQKDDDYDEDNRVNGDINVTLAVIQPKPKLFISIREWKSPFHRAGKYLINRLIKKRQHTFMPSHGKRWNL